MLLMRWTVDLSPRIEAAKEPEVALSEHAWHELAPGALISTQAIWTKPTSFDERRKRMHRKSRTLSCRAVRLA